MPRRIVLDTNVLVSALLTPHGAPGQLLDLVLAGEIGIAVDDRITAEYRDVVHRPRFGFEAADANRVLGAISALAEHVAGAPLLLTLPDADDAPFLEVAAAGRVDALVTGNARHFVPLRGQHGVPVLTPREFLDLLRRPA